MRNNVEFVNIDWKQSRHHPTLLLQRTEMSIHVVFVNIDWNESRRYRQPNRNLRFLKSTITDIVQRMNPTVICMCEVGEANIPLSDWQMEHLAECVISAWNDAVTEHVKLCIMCTTGYPYMTIYNGGVVQCTDHRILDDLYKTGEQARTAQAFVLVAPGGESVDVINVHAPSQNKRLTDFQRRLLLTNLLQSKSQARRGFTIGNVPFLIGGDMNTTPILMSQLIQTCVDNGSLHTYTGVRAYVRNGAKDGDLCITGGILTANTLSTTAGNHDPTHDPYGICWSMPQYTAQRISGN